MYSDPFNHFGGPPPVFMFFFILIALIILGSILFAVIKGISQWSYNNSQPVLSVYAVVRTKRTRVSGGHETSSSTYYYVTFEVESGDRMEFQISGDQYGFLVEGDRGKLTFRGTRFHGFSRDLPNTSPTQT